MKVRELLRRIGVERIPNVMLLSGGQMDEPDKLGAVVSAMLNCEGGAIVFGAQLRDEDALAEVVGVSAGEAERLSFERQLNAVISPGTPIFVQGSSVDDKELVVVDVPPGKNPPYASGNIIYALHGGHPEPATSEEIREWVLRGGAEANRWENRPAFANAIDGIERTAVERAVREAEKSGRLILDVSSETSKLLSEFLVMRYGRLLNAGLVLFGRGVGRWLPQSQVRFVHFAGRSTDADILHSDLYDGPISETIDILREYIVSHSPQVQVFDTMTGNRHQSSPYPVMAVREALVNAFAHRDYESAMGGITIRMFSNRLEISNSGKLPDGITANALNSGKSQLSRLVNPLIANNLYLRGYMERIGRGVSLIRNECQRVGTKATWSVKVAGQVTVVFEANRMRSFNDESINQSLNLNNDSALNIVQLQENAVVDETLSGFVNLLIDHPCARRPELQKMTGMSRGEVQGLLDKLKSVHLLTYLGSKKTGGYYVVRMKEIDFDYKMIVQHCFEAEHMPEHRVHGGYQAEKIRKHLAKMMKDKLIRCEPCEDVVSANHFDFLGFTDRGRELFLENGQIKAMYRV